MDFEPEIGSIIEFDDGDEYRLAIVIDTIGKKKLAILSASGDRMRTVPGDITFMVGSASVDNPDRAQKKLVELDTTIEQRRGDVELEMLWEFVREDDEPQTPQALAELMFADTSSPTILGILRALRDNPVYFKGRRDGTFEPRPDGQVASLKRQRQIEREKQEQRQRILDIIADTLQLPEETRASHIESAIGDDDALRDAIYLLQDFAAHGKEFKRRDDAVEILDDLIRNTDYRLEGHMDQKAFFLMVALGLWHEHQNLSLHQYRISPKMPEAIVKEAERMAETTWEPESFRRDFTGWTTITIDAPSSMDLDDALSCRPTIDGGWELAIHIADPSAFVDIGSPLDKEAERRGTSIYLPSGSIPMFPRTFSEGQMSLLPECIRPALTTQVTFNQELEIVDTEIFASTICVDRRFGYDEVDKVLREGQTGRFADMLQHLEYIAEHCRTVRTEKGGAYFDLPDTKVIVDDPVTPTDVVVKAIDTDTQSRTLVSEMMILNNDLIGQFCARNDIPIIYRIQEGPDEPLIDDHILSIPEGIARTFAQIRRMKPGDISTQPSLHFGLGLHAYAQASSPIRRYSDLICQRQVKAFLNDLPLPYDQAAMLQHLGTIDRSVSEASNTERATNRYWILYYLSQCKDEPFDSVVVDHYDDRGSRVSVFLSDCAYRSSCALRRKVPVGDSVQVVVERVNPRFDVLNLRQAPEES